MQHRTRIAGGLIFALMAWSQSAAAQPAPEPAPAPPEPGAPAPPRPEVAPETPAPEQAPAPGDAAAPGDAPTPADAPEPPAPEPPEPPAPAPSEPTSEAPEPSEPTPEAPTPKEGPAGNDADDAEVSGPEIWEGEQPPLAEGHERPVPNYDGREPEPIDAGDVLIWIPRGIFYPLYAVSEYVLRRPLGALTTAIDENDVADIVGDFFTFGPNDNYGIIPSGLIDFGFRPSIGLYFFGDDVGDVDGLGVRAHVAFGGLGFYRTTASVRYQIEDAGFDTHPKMVQLKGVWERRPDWLIWGQGPDAPNEARSRYQAQFIEAIAHYEGGFWRSSYVNAFIAVRDATFGNDVCCHSIAVQEAVDRNLYDTPPLFEDGYTVGRIGTELYVDTRPQRNNYEGLASDHVSPPGTGIKIGPRVELGLGLRESFLDADQQAAQRPLYIKYGGTIGGYLDIYNQRVIGLQVVADFVDGLETGGVVPFRELTTLGGNRPLRGFIANRLYDRSAVAAQLEYTWPIWVWLDGSVHYAMGNVFGERLDNFQFDKLRQSFGFGFKDTSARDHAFEFLIAGGTDTFERGAGLDSFRLVFGSSAGF